MTDLSDDKLALLGALLDGEATAEQTAQATNLLATDPTFREAHDRLMGSQTRARALFAPASLTTPAADAAAVGRRRRSRVVGLAAAILLLASAAFYASRVPDPLRIRAEALHLGFVINPFPTTICDTPDKFLAYTREHLGTPIAARFDTPIQLVGWRGAGSGYDHEGSRTRLLLAYAQPKTPVVVLFQPSGTRAPRLDAASGLALHRKRLGPIDAYEITPLAQPSVLELLSLAPR